MGKIVLIIGGIKSRKSSFALRLFSKNKKVYFVATAKPTDKEMKQRIKQHRHTRPDNFLTIEETTNIVEKIKLLPKNSNVIVDCINFWVANLMQEYSDNQILSEAKNLCNVLKEKNFSVLVTNEVGMSLVAVNKVARRFQDLLGKVNQIIAKNADVVYFMVSGIPLKIKD